MSHQWKKVERILKNLVPYLSKDQIWNVVDKVLKKYWPERNIPIEIDFIVELAGLDIVTLSGLKSIASFSAYLSLDFSCIYVDRSESDSFSRGLSFRYAFSIAHEFGHYILHRKVYDFFLSHWDVKGKDGIDLLHEFHEVIFRNTPLGEWMEWQANTFASFILMPKEIFENKWKETKRLFIKKMLKKTNDISMLDLTDYIDDFIAEEMSKYFRVSPSAVLTRKKLSSV